MSTSSGSWQIWIDTGGTFTDCIAETPNGETVRLKVLSNSTIRGTIVKKVDDQHVQIKIHWPVNIDIFKDFEFRVAATKFSSTIVSIDLTSSIVRVTKSVPEHIVGSSIEITSNEEVPVFISRLLTATPFSRKIPSVEMKLGSTKGTNAILERKGATTAFLVTKGFKDLLLIGTQQRPDLFTCNIIKPLPLYNFVVEVDERIDSDGKILIELADNNIESIVTQLKQRNIESIAIALVNSYKNPIHEHQLSSTLLAEGYTFVSSSSVLSSAIKILSRAETAVANAYLAPIIHKYISGIERGLPGSRLNIMTSSGSLVKAKSFYPKDSLLSGPAGGVVGAVSQAKRSGIERIIAFDMGGTSTDVSLYDNEFNYRFESVVGNLKIMSPSLAIETIAAGGGSICDFDGHRLIVGPQSAGASPGPACYGAGGPLTITDVNLLLGRLNASIFTIPIYPEKSQKALELLLNRISITSGIRYQEEQILESFIQIANEKMADAIRKISVQHGHDPRNFALLSFGGAGGQHACALASILGMRNILIPYDAGLLSAYGIGHAPVEKFEEISVLNLLDNKKSSLDNSLHALFIRAKNKLISDGFSSKDIYWKKSLLFLRFVGQDTAIEIDYKQGSNIELAFKRKYVSIYGHWTNRPIEIESLRVIAALSTTANKTNRKKIKPYKPPIASTQVIFSNGIKKLGNIYRWENLLPGASIKGPALIISDNSTSFVDQGWTWNLDAANNANLTLLAQEKSNVNQIREADLELFTNRFSALAQEMGALLQRTSFSVNVKERLDFSCAVLDSKGYLVVNAPHIPVHLGSLGVCVREVAKIIDMTDGDVIVTNHPALGGSHLPDVTVIKPVYYNSKLVGYVANRAHHAEMGGRKPGSMPADATTLEEEGVIVSPTYLIKGGKSQWKSIRKILLSGKYPTRSIDENLADLNAALASVNLGEEGLQSLCDVYGEPQVVLNMKSLREHASSILKKKISKLVKKHFSATEFLDDGSVLAVSIRCKKDRLKIDFTGSSKVHAGNLNATKAIVQSVVLYCLRLLVDQPIPMNEGLMKPIDLVLPIGLLNPDFNTRPMPAVVGGNTEISQRLTDTLLKAFELAACSQGTMNNFLFGNKNFGYYETICGGVGAGKGFNGADAVHQHMTNTRITDPEILELRYPVRLERFEIRQKSGGKGKWNGGNGIEREIFFKEELEVNLLTQHRTQQPYGLDGGKPGKTGEQILVGSKGTKRKLKGMDSLSVKSGDRLIIKTPGGGGYGKSKK